VRTADGQVLRQEILENPHRAVGKQKEILVAEWLVRRGIDMLHTVRAVNKGPGYVLREAGVEMRRIRRTRFADELALFRREIVADDA